MAYGYGKIIPVPCQGHGGAGLAAIKFRLAEGTHLVYHLPLTTLNLVDFFPPCQQRLLAFACLSSFLLISNFLPQAKQNVLLGPSILSRVRRNVSRVISRPKRTITRTISPSWSPQTPHSNRVCPLGEARQCRRIWNDGLFLDKIQDTGSMIPCRFQLLMILAYTRVSRNFSEATVQIFWARVTEAPFVLCYPRLEINLHRDV